MPQDIEQPLSIETVDRRRWWIEGGKFRWRRRSFNTVALIKHDLLIKGLIPTKT